MDSGLSDVIVLASGDLGIYHDQDATEPVTSLHFVGQNFQPPLRLAGIRPEIVYIRNESEISLFLVEPCREVLEGDVGPRIGFMNPKIFDLDGTRRGLLCDRPNKRLVPGEMVKVIVDIHDLERGLAAGDHTFTTVSGAVGSSGDGPVQPPAGMVGWWPGDGNASDILAGNDGTLENGTTFAMGIVGEGFGLDGVDDFVLVPDHPRLNITGDVTVDLWAKRKNLNAADLISKGGGFTGTADVPTAYGLFLFTGDLVGAFFERADGSNVAILGFAKADTEFHHYAYVRSGDTHKVFRDGVVITADSFTGRPGDTTGRPLIIGSFQSDPNPEDFAAPLRGVIDKVEIFNRALSEAEIRAIFDAGSAGKIKPTLPFHGWHFDSPSALGPALDDVRVRTVIDLAINEAAIDPNFFFLANWPSLEGPIQSFDLEQANQLMADAGFADGFVGLCIEPVGSGPAAIASEMVQHLAAISITAVVGGTSCGGGLLFVEPF